jgi:hypothetical protein
MHRLKRIRKVEDELLRYRFRHMTDEEHLAFLTEEQRQLWTENNVSDAEIVRRVKNVLEDWGWL